MQFFDIKPTLLSLHFHPDVALHSPKIFIWGDLWMREGCSHPLRTAPALGTSGTARLSALDSKNTSRRAWLLRQEESWCIVAWHSLPLMTGTRTSEPSIIARRHQLVSQHSRSEPPGGRDSPWQMIRFQLKSVITQSVVDDVAAWGQGHRRLARHYVESPIVIRALSDGRSQFRLSPS